MDLIQLMECPARYFDMMITRFRSQYRVNHDFNKNTMRARCAGEIDNKRVFMLRQELNQTQDLDVGCFKRYRLPSMPKNVRANKIWMKKQVFSSSFGKVLRIV